MFRVVLADTNVLYGRTARDYLLYAHEAELIEIHWSDTILEELRRNLAENFAAKNQQAAEVADRLVAILKQEFPEAGVDVEPEHLAVFSGISLPDPDDNHVLAAALAADADIICTNNKKHFPRRAADLANVQIFDLDQTLSALIKRFPTEMVDVHRTVVRNNSRLDEATTISKLEAAQCHRAAGLLRSALAARSKPSGGSASLPVAPAAAPVSAGTAVGTCGGRTRKGGPCRHKVRGGGRCWQHPNG